MIGRMASHLGILFMRAIAWLPLRVVRAMGWVLGQVLFVLVRGRRRVVLTNLRLCFPQRSEAERLALARQVFVRFSQAWLDRAWLWHAPDAVTRRRLTLTGALHEFDGDAPTLVFAPHFVGMDAGWTAFSQQVPRTSIGIYAVQSNAVIDAWILKGRKRYSAPDADFVRADGVRELVGALRRGKPLYLLPDMDFGPTDSVFVPFFGVPTATLPSLSRFARLGQAKVVPMTARLTPGGYEVEVHPAWTDFPSGDLAADARRMNAALEQFIGAMPEQYYWVHKRFKTRPPGDARVY